MDSDAPLPTDVLTLQGMVRALQAENADLRTQLQRQAEQFQRTIDDLRAEVAALKAKLDRATTHRFGRRSERTPKPPKVPGDGPAKRRHDHGRSPLPAHLERRDTVLDLTPDERRCSGCGGDRVCIGQTQTEQLDCDPTPYFVRRTIRKTYACQQCPPTVRAEDRIRTATPSTVGPIDKGLCGPGLLAEVLVGKFLDHLPLHRQVARIGRAGVTVSESTLGDWVKQSAVLLTSLYQLMLERVRTCPVLWSDDTRSRFAQPGERTMPHGHFWVGIGDPTAPYTAFHFTTGYDAASGPDQFLGGFRGHVHADCLAQYNGLFAAGAKHVACWSHARRKFLGAGDPGAKAVERINRLYHIEHTLPAPDSPEHIVARRATRQARALPILNDLKAWLDAALGTALPKSALGAAIRYVANHWAAFVRYTEDGRLSIDNNLSERTLRLIAVGRSNWKFVGSAKAGAHAAVHFSVVGTCRHLGLDATAYLREVLPALHALGEKPTADQLAPLLPDVWAKRQQSRLLVA
ncbi:IS66 family transposase [Frigoriglobus tundricola]|uniref:IS66 family transposase n=1 Tax=Frigoriglobus tundricola TaxID=2774151 RepID=A0A6M5YJE0_9BACT|nr:IS66 family transposase [Frigoriglobus tundricola]QJW92513.1 Mobile element protein [Frigoriglobus tundricola]QJW93253.1 Mobile element protein [Frigoriglobus tundricola]QJW94171.1 Mobile element protein [Frigoriglobus tundricola]QJW94177.1 Mobile element protein [Frigoriglobus tundricola]QJW95154.1 Mobile element protein [Frigoriglobus tundricola]